MDVIERITAAERRRFRR